MSSNPSSASFSHSFSEHTIAVKSLEKRIQEQEIYRAGAVDEVIKLHVW